MFRILASPSRHTAKHAALALPSTGLCTTGGPGQEAGRLLPPGRGGRLPKAKGVVAPPPHPIIIP